MTPQFIETLFSQVAQGEIEPREALTKLEGLSFEHLEFACVDHHRNLRQGSPEVIYSEFKTPTEIVGIAQAILRQGANLLCTRLQPEAAQLLEQSIDGIVIDKRSRIGFRIQSPIKTQGLVGVLCAGTSDISIAEEARLTLDFYGISNYQRYDVGVAGLHRLLAIKENLTQCDAIIVVAGMEGALPSVVAGLVACPVIAVPTSVGYGTNFAGMTALLSMLNTCSAGVTVVNIDNGFGAASAAFRMLRQLNNRG